jgi:hypothetical protein
VEANPVYGILKEALKLMPEEYPFRGPKEFKSGDLIYNNTWEGSLERYSGEEQIKKGAELIYKANSIGGLVDKRVQA